MALVDRSPKYSKTQDNWSNTRLYYIEKGDYPDNDGTYWVNVTGYDELNMAAPSSLGWFITTVQMYFPSDYLFLSLWDHNWGWHPGWFQKDLTSNADTMKYSDISEELKKINGSKIDIVGYDACVSSHVEVLHTWRPYSEYFVGSQDYIGWGGVDYSRVVGSVYNASTIGPRELSIDIAESILTDSADHCSSAISLGDDFDSLVMYISKLASLFIKYLESIRERLILIRDSVPSVPHYPSDEYHKDIFGLALAVRESLSEFPDLVEAADSILRVMNSIVLYNKVSGWSCREGKGLSIYWPKSNTFKSLNDSEEYLKLSFSQASSWDEFLILF